MFINIQIPVIPLSITGNHFRYAATIEPSNPFSRIWSRKRVMEQWRSKRLVEMHADIDKYFRLLSYRVVCVSFNKEQKKYLGARKIQSGWYGVMCPLHRPLQVKFDNEQSDLIHKQDSSRSSSVTSSSSRPTSATRMRWSCSWDRLDCRLHSLRIWG